jgi:hypothetical protein
MRNVLLAILAALLLFAFWLAAYSRAPLSPAITAAPANYPPIRDGCRGTRSLRRNIGKSKPQPSRNPNTPEKTGK